MRKVYLRTTTTGIWFVSRVAFFHRRSSGEQVQSVAPTLDEDARAFRRRILDSKVLGCDKTAPAVTRGPDKCI